MPTQLSAVHLTHAHKRRDEKNAIILHNVVSVFMQHSGVCIIHIYKKTAKFQNLHHDISDAEQQTWQRKLTLDRQSAPLIDLQM